VIVFFGSQTGTAEEYANRIAKEAQKRFGLRCMVADIEDYDMDRLDRVPTNHLVVFVMATYGEGEPTDNATEFWNFLIADSEGTIPTFSKQEAGEEDEVDAEGNSTEGRPLHNLHYVMFGLGNRTYEHFNEVSRRIDARLQELGAHRVGARGEGDDDGNLEEDFIAWKEDTWVEVAKVMGVTENTNIVHEPAYTVTELSEDAYDADSVYTGELIERRPDRLVMSTYDIKNPYIANLRITRELFSADAGRNCVHAEVDLRGSNIRYQAGDHLAIWPINSEYEVERAARVCGVADRLNTVVRVASNDPSANKKYPFPVPTTYHTILRHYIDINSCPSREFVAILAQYIEDEGAKAYIQRLGSDKDAYHKEVLEAYMNLATLIEQAAAHASSELGPEGITIPLAVAIEGLGRLQPRYYSISSSPKIHPDHAHATVVVVDHEVAHGRRFRGVATNYLYAAHCHLTAHKNGQVLEASDAHPKYVLKTETAEDGSVVVRVPIFVRPCANFKLPRDPTRPVIMVGPGTGVAPFRGFVQERVHQVRSGIKVGPTVLFFGCRRRDHDFMYREEWDAQFAELAEHKGEMILAFSREQAQKVYVQDRMRERQADIWRWLNDEGGYFYVCGDAKNMARAVNNQLVEIAHKIGGMSEEDAVQWVKKLRASGRYQEDVWS
jgi:NADPH-ferrihemoprotein reductase